MGGVFHVKPMKALAVYRPGGGISVGNGSVATVGSDGRLYIFSRKGDLVSSGGLNGLSGRVEIPDLTTLDGIDFSPDGSLFGLINGVLWRLNIFGSGTLYGWGLAGSSDIDISDDYVLSLAANDQLSRYNLSDLTWVSRQGLSGLAGIGAIVSR